MLLTVHICSTSMTALEHVKKSITNNLPFLIGDHIYSKIHLRFEFVPDSDGPDLFECEELIATH